MTGPQKPTTGKTIQSVGIALEILEELRHRGTAGVTDLAAAIDRSKSTAHHYVKTLEEYGYVERSGTEYQLGLRLLTLGGQAREHETVYTMSKNEVDRLARETGETARLVVSRAGYSVTIYQSTGADVEEAVTHVGSEAPLHSTAAGKAYLANLDRSDVEAILDRVGMERFTEHTITDREELYGELDRIHERGVAYDDEEQCDGVRCVASPITTEDGAVLGAISVSGPVDRFDEERFRTELPNAVQNVVGVVEINTTYADWEA
jgi:DNA-binding IclR family transcriptional regulator